MWLAGICARRRTHFLLLRQKKVSKEKATLLSVSLRFATGNLRCSDAGRAAELTARLRRFVQTTAASLITKHARFDAHAAPRPALLGTARREPATRAIAALGSVPRAERSDGPCVPTPLRLRLRRGDCGVSMGVEAPMLRNLTCRSCLNEARQRVVSSAAHPASSATQVCPVAQRRGRRRGARFFCLLFLRAQEK